MPIEIRELAINTVVSEETAPTAAGGDEAFRTQFGNNNAPEAEPPGTGKTLAAPLLRQNGADDDREGAGLVADGAQPSEGINHGVKVLAWARVDGTSSSSTAPASREGGDARRVKIDSFSWGTAPPSEAGGTTVHDAPYDPTFTGGVTVTIGDVASGDDVVVDGRIITAEGFGFGDGSVRFVTGTIDPF
ncbi:MAG TPA: hypothetical protein VGN83_11255 [Falsiroseomonas sp.]|jgi:hypothetical protein|nr:hypothetical protein [Falsiroseomonas sp.]